MRYLYKNYTHFYAERTWFSVLSNTHTLMKLHIDNKLPRSSVFDKGTLCAVCSACEGYRMSVM